MKIKMSFISQKYYAYRLKRQHRKLDRYKKKMNAMVEEMNHCMERASVVWEDVFDRYSKTNPIMKNYDTYEAFHNSDYGMSLSRVTGKIEIEKSSGSKGNVVSLGKKGIEGASFSFGPVDREKDVQFN